MSGRGRGGWGLAGFHGPWELSVRGVWDGGWVSGCVLGVLMNRNNNNKVM